MQLIPPADSVEVISIGDAALDGLMRMDMVKVLASVSRALYVLDGENDLYWVTGEDSPMHRRCVHISSPLPRAPVETTLDIRNWRLDSCLLGSLDTGHPCVWNAPPLPSQPAPMDDLPSRVADLCCTFLEGHMPAGWGVLITFILNKVQQRIVFPEPVLQQSIPAIAWLTIEQMLTALKENDHHVLLGLALRLGGMGEGLTPSGDDFLGGLLFCFHVLRQAYPGRLDIFWNHSELIAQFEARTNRISYTFLSDHAHGHTLEPLHLLASGLLAGQPDAYLLSNAEKLVHVGHSTGWDLLSGFITGMAAILPHIPISTVK